METAVLLLAVAAAFGLRFWASLEYAKFLDSAPAEVQEQLRRAMARGSC